MEATIHHMVHSMDHGGPDFQDYLVYADDKLALGHCRLSILDLSEHSNQPFCNEEADIVYNGEVYNFNEIRNDLEALGRSFKTSSDTEVILEAYLQWGTKAFSKFRGMFAFCIWDKRTKTLCLCRDRIGVKPLYYYHHEGLLVFASEIKAILQHPGIDRRLNTDVVPSFLQLGYIPDGQTMYHHIHTLPAASFLTLGPDKPSKIQLYWTLPVPKKETPFKDSRDVLDQLEQHLKDSVRLRMVSDVPVGIFLSGGIDSSLITAMSQELSSKPIQTFSIGFEEAEHDESIWAQKVSDHLGTQHHNHIFTEQDFLELIPKLPFIFDEPLGDIAALPTVLLSAIAKQNVKVCMSGEGGDEIAGGYVKYHYAKTFQRWIQKIPYPIRRAMQPALRLLPIALVAKLSSATNLASKYHKFCRSFGAKSLPDFIRRSGQYLSDQELALFFDRKAKKISPVDLGEPSPKMVLSTAGYYDLKTYLHKDLLPKLDRSTMSVGLEGREPLLDHQLIEFCMGIPDRYKALNKTPKFLLKRLLQNYLPNDYIDRPKQGFTIPVEKWLRTQYSQVLRDLSSDTAFLSTFHLNAQTISSEINGFLDHKPSMVHIQVIWNLFTLYQWYGYWVDPS